MGRLALQGIQVAYGARQVLDDVSLTVEPGSFVALLGPNGAGKTTLLRVAGGWMTPTRGTVTIDDQPFPGGDRRVAAKMLASVGADEDTLFAFTARESVALGRFPWRGPFGEESATDRSLVDQALTRTGLEPLAERTVSTLSAGERQRVRLARCLAQDARVALFDEPTAHLDWRHAREAAALLRAWAHDEERAVLAVLHDLNLAARFADRIALLHHGRLVCEGPPTHVLTPERVAQVYGVPVEVTPHPQGGGPVLIPMEER